MTVMIWQQAAALVLIASLITWLVSLAGSKRGGWGMRAAAALSALIGLVPVKGVSAAGMVLSLSPSLSVTGTALWGTLLLSRLMGGKREWAIEAKRRMAFLILAVSVPVYISFIGGIGPDLYDSGYGFTPWDMVLGVSAVLLFIRGSWMSLVLMACLLAHAAGLVPGSNIFDTLIDGPSFILSLIVLAGGLFSSRRSLPNRPGL